MTLWESIILAVVEGLTEFLPVSSTGHMVITQALLGIESTEYVRAFTVMIQFGAILSVVVLYFKRFFRFALPHDMWHGDRGKLVRFLSRFRFYFQLLVALLPAVVLGVLFNDWVDEALGSIWVVAINLLLGGVVMLFIDRLVRDSHRTQVTYRNAFVIGLFQTIAMFLPGMSRSMCTIVGGMAVGLKREVAAEFSFFLAVPTMLGASVYQILKFWKEGQLAILEENILTLVVGNVVSFVVALVAIKGFISYLQRHGFVAFGIYRIIVGGAIILMLLSGMDLALFQ